MSTFTSPYPPVTFPSSSFYGYVLTYDGSYSPESRVIVDGVSGHPVTRAAFKDQCLTLASSLRSVDKAGLLPLPRGATVTVLSPNSTLYPALIIAFGAAGVVGAFASSAYVDQELAHAFKVSSSSHILVHVALLPTAVAALGFLGYSPEDIKKRVLLLHAKADLPAEVAAQGWVTLDALPTARLPSIPEKFDEAQAKSETALIFFSSGTTGRSKAVALSHYNVNAILTQVGATWNYYQADRDVILGVIPFFHVFGGVILLLFAYVKGVPVVTLPRFDPAQFLSSIPKYKITVALLVPPLLTFLAKHPVIDQFDLSTLRLIVVGAAPVAASTIQLTIDRFTKKGIPVQLSQAYGLTETSGSLGFLPVERLQDSNGSVGPLLPNIEGRLVDESGADVPQGAPGELWVRGPNVMKGYAGDPEATAAVITSDGWFKTGDVVVRDAQGFLTIVDRWKELIKYKGFQVPPAELEAVLATHPGVADAGVIGVYSDVETTELPRAYVVPKDAALLQGGDQEAFKQSVQDFLKDRVANYKLLRGGVVLIEAIPRSAAGKILRKDLRALAKQTGAKL